MLRARSHRSRGSAFVDNRWLSFPETALRMIQISVSISVTRYRSAQVDVVRSVNRVWLGRVETGGGHDEGDFGSGR